jgi:hypothetical protein
MWEETNAYRILVRKSLGRSRERRREMENNFEMGLRERGFKMEDDW